MRQQVVLIHGYNASYRDMLILKENLEKLNLTVSVADLPLKNNSIEKATKVFKQQIEKLLLENKKIKKINLVGHSTGGLIIRKFLSQLESLKQIGRCVQIATPNQGSLLAELAVKYCKPLIRNYQTLKYLQPDNIKELSLKDRPQIEIGAIAGNKSNFFYNLIFRVENDGRVRLNSVKYDGLTELIVVPYGHKKIHYQIKTAKLINVFLANGKFNYQKEVIFND